MNTAAIDACVGRVNSVLFDGYYPPGTLLMLAPETERYVTHYGEYAYDVIFHLNYRSTGWNKFFRGSLTPPAFQEVSPDGAVHAEPAADGVHLYNSADFAQLFRL